MENIFILKDYKKRKRDQYIKKYGSKIDLFISNFIQDHFYMDFWDVTDQYLSTLVRDQENHWDYCSFREVLLDAIEDIFGTELYDSLKKERWFDPKWITMDQILDKCLTCYILGQEPNQAIKKV